MTIINLTQHNASADQINVGVVDLEGGVLAALKGFLNFSNLPSKAEIEDAATGITAIAKEHSSGDSQEVMIGGAPFLMAPLENALRKEGLLPLYAFSVRESVETTNDDGSISKTAVFRHKGFVGR